jgi:hypothetical protein
MGKRKQPELLGGPYVPPKHEIGSVLRCKIRGRRTVAGLTDARIQWPFAYQDQGGGKRLIIVTPELARAIRTESTVALCYWFGVSRNLVSDWKKALDVPRVTPGALKLMQDTIGKHFDRDDLARGGQAAAKVRKRHGRQKPPDE